MNKIRIIGTGIILSGLIVTGNIESFFDTKIDIKQKVNHIINLSYEEISDKLGKKYNSIIEFDKADGLEYFCDVEYFSDIEQVKVYEQFSKILSKYPDFVIQKAGIRKIYILKSIKNKNGEEIGGFTIYGKMFLNGNGTNLNKFDHELYHILDNINMDDDNLWKNIFYNSKPEDIEFSDTLNQEVEGYANLYGKKRGVNEDQATISEYLLSSKKKKRLLERTKTDIVLKNKIMLITGCYFDEKDGIFTRDLTKQEYKQMFNFDDYEYYGKWGRKNGKFYMDYNFWNNIGLI